MMKHIRILPVTVVALILIFGLKLSTVWTDAQGLLFDVKVSEVQASETSEDAELESTEQAEVTETEDDAVSEAEEASEATIAPVDAAGTRQFSQAEVAVLERLVDRRAELDRQQEELEMRDNLLKATETRIDDKIAKLKEMEGTLQELLKLHDDQEKAQMESLVKIYEKMKPKDAARIFNNLEMDILIDVASNIKESKMAPILASMSSDRANKLTVELATRQQLPGTEDKKG